LLACVLLLVGAFEVVTLASFGRISRVQRTFAAEYEQALGSTPYRTVLVLGNSLLDAGVDFPRLAQGLAPEWDGKRLLVANTGFLDWYFGTRKLLEAGARPRVVALVLSPRQLVSGSIRGEYSAYYLIRTFDIPRAARDLELNPTQAAGLMAGNLSNFYGARAEIRKWLMGALLPGFEPLARRLRSPAPGPLDEARTFESAVRRLKEYRELLAGYSIRFVLVLPPQGVSDEGVREVSRAGESAGVPVLGPAGKGALRPEHYSDGFHLNERGAAIHTAALIPLIREQITSTAWR
jgi:hypothetical protein